MSKKPFVKNPKHHIFGVTTLATFLTQDGKPAQKYLMVVVYRDKETLPIFEINSAQQVAENMIKGAGAKEIKSIDFISSSYFGHMTEAEFSVPPEEDSGLPSLADLPIGTNTTSPYDA